MKLFVVAYREFLATVTTKGFLFGAIVFPAIMAASIPLIIKLIDSASPSIYGSVGVIDQSGELTPEDIDAAEQRPTDQQRAIEELTAQAEDAGVPTGGMAAAAAAGGMRRDIRFELLPAGTTLEDAKHELMGAADGVGHGDSDQARPRPRLAVVVVPPGSVRRTPGAPGGPGIGGYTNLEVYVREGTDPEVRGVISSRVADAVIDARVRADDRVSLSSEELRSLLRRPGASAVAVSADGQDRTALGAAALFMPIAFMMLLWISVFTAGQFLLYSTIEEKSSRVMEVLLSAVSPMQLLVGKLLGQFGVGMVILLVYAGVGVFALVSMAMGHLINPADLVLLAIYFLIAFFSIAALMAAVGSAVNDVKEANALMGPIMMVLILPMVLWMPVSRAPNSALAEVLSFIPPISPFIMVVRISGSEAIPFWQIPATIAFGVLAAFAFAWFAAKIFRIGSLMYGKPPDLRTLIRWIRMS